MEGMTQEQADVLLWAAKQMMLAPKTNQPGVKAWTEFTEACTQLQDAIDQIEAE